MSIDDVHPRWVLTDYPQCTRILVSKKYVTVDMQFHSELPVCSGSCRWPAVRAERRSFAPPRLKLLIQVLWWRATHEFQVPYLDICCCGTPKPSNSRYWSQMTPKQKCNDWKLTVSQSLLTQLVQNAAARLLMGVRKHQHISAINATFQFITGSILNDLS